MAEEGLKAFHKITKNINNQDERIWRQTSAKKCLKKEIEKVEEQTKQFELQIATLKKDPLYKKHEEFSQILGDNIKEHLQIHKLISLSISAKNEEVERKEKEIKSWDKKYMDALADLKVAYEMKRTLLDSTDPTYKKLTDLNSAQKIAQVWLKQLQASSKRRQKGRKQLEMIKEKIFHKIITNFTSAVSRKREYVEKIAKFKELEEKKKKMVRELFEAQEALKKLRVRHTQIPSGMFTRRVPNLQPPRTLNKSDGRITDSSSDINKLKRISMDQNRDTQSEKKDMEGSSAETEYKEPPIPKKKSKLPLNRLNIISNKIVSLPPLKSILSRQRSRMDTSFNRSLDTSSSFRGSQNSQTSSHTNPTKEAESTPRCSQEERTEPEKISNLSEIQNTLNNNGKEAQSSKISDTPKPSDYLKNLKFTSQSSKFQVPKIKSPIGKQNSQMNVIHKASILKCQASKRSLNESLQDVDLDSSQRKREKNVNFASPIHQQFDINQTLSSNEANTDLSSPMNTTSNMNMSGFLDDNVTTMIAPNYDGFNMGNSQFSFAPNDDNRPGPDQGNMPNMAPMSIFGSTTDTGPSFGFSFGGSSKSTGEIWDLFS